MVIAALTIVNHWANRCIDSEIGMFDLCDTEMDDLWQQPFSFTGNRVMNPLKKISRSLLEKLLSKLAFHKNVWVTLLILLYIGRFVHIEFLACSWHTFESSKTRNLPAILFLCYENKGEVIKTEFNSRQPDSFVFTLNVMYMFVCKQLHSYIMLHKDT